MAAKIHGLQVDSLNTALKERKQILINIEGAGFHRGNVWPPNKDSDGAEFEV